MGRLLSSLCRCIIDFSDHSLPPPSLCCSINVFESFSSSLSHTLHSPFLIQSISDMHFWIDKRSSYGLGHYQRPGMSGFGYYPRRTRAAKTGGTTPPAPHSQQSSASSSSAAGSSSQPRQHIAPSSSAQHGKPTNHHHHHHHRSHHHRNQRSETALTADVELQQDFADLDSHHVVHSMFQPDDMTTSHPLEATARNGSNGGSIMSNQWLPIQIICGLCMILAITLVLLKLYFESYMTGFQVLSLILMSFVLLILTTLLSLLRTRRKRPSTSSQLQRHSLVESQVQSSITSGSQQQTVIVQSSPPSATCEPPPPYALALTLPEKQSDIKITTPPPSYEKINIIQ